MPLKVVLKNFLNHFETLEARKKLGDDLFEAEFQSLKELTERLKLDPEYACTEGQKEVNRKKNRYKDILPYDLSRVILSEYPGVPGSDYINANLIKGASGSRAYIASQGPLPTTVMDFWRMIWECEVQVIIMACNEKESGKYKCERYWPNEGDKKQYGNITVELVKWKQVCPDFLLRTLRARCGPEERTLCQFHYWSWPDHGVPTSVGPIVDLVRLVRDCQASEALPVLVHCSAGCGRTGTICAIDYVWGLMRVGKLTDSFSLYQIIREMRMQRIAMVQTKEQYVLVHRVVAALFEQQLRIIDSHTYENLDEDGEPLLGSTGPGVNVPSNDKIYENLDDLGLEDRGREKENTENDEKCDKEKEVTPGSEESLSKAPAAQDATTDSAGNEETSQRQARASRSMSWSPEPNSVATSSSALSSSDPRGGSRSSMITDDEDSQSCKEDSVQAKKCLDKKKNGDEQGSALSRGRSMSATDICTEDSAGKAAKGDAPGKIVGKATVIRRPSIARLKALFEKSDSDDVSAGEANRRRPVFRSYSQRITPRRPSVAQVPDGAEAPSMASKFKPLLSKRKSLGPSARKAKEFRDQEKSQRQIAAGSTATSKKENQADKSVPETVHTTKVMTTPPVLMVSSSSDANTRPQGAASSLSVSAAGGDTWEKNVLYKSFSSSNLSGLASHANGNVPSSKPLSEASRMSLSSSVSSKLGQKCDPPPQLPTKKRTAQTLYAPIPFYTVDPATRKSQTLPATAGNPNNLQPQQGQARGSSIYDFLPRKDADMPPRLPPKTKPSKLQTPVVPISALNNTYVNVSDMLLARNELMSRLSDGRYINVNPEVKENLKRIESVIRQHPRGAIIDLTSRKSFNDRIAAGSKYEQVWDGKTFVKRDPKAETEKTVTVGQPAKNEGDSWFAARRDCYESGTTIDNSSNKEKSATLPSAFRTHDRANQRDFPAQGAKQDALTVSSSDMDTSDVYTTHDERSGTEYDTLFAESSDATETDAPSEKDRRWKAMVGAHPGHAHVVPPQLAKNMPGYAAVADTEVKRPLPAYETIYPLQPGFVARRVPYTGSNPPPKPPRTYGYCAGGKYEAGHVGAPVAYPKRAQLSESIYQVPPQPRTTPHMISRPLHRLPSSCDPSAFLPSAVPNFGAAPFVPLYHPRQGVSSIRSPDYENVYACRSAVGSGQSAAKQQGVGIVKHHSEYRPQVKAPPRESESSKPGKTLQPTAKAPLQHSFSDASIYEALRGSLSQQPQHQQEQQRLADIQAQYAVVVKPKKSGLQKSKTVVSESALLGPSAPPRCRRQPQQDSADSSDGAGCKVSKQGAAGDVAEVHAKPSKKGTASGNKGSSKEGSSSGSEGSGFISGTLSKAFGRLNPFYKGNSGASDEAKKKTTPQSTTTSPKKPEVPKKPGNLAMLRSSKKQPAPQPKASKPPDFTGRPLSQGPSDAASEHWTQV